MERRVLKQSLGCPLILHRCGPLHTKEISAIDSDSATYECKLLADDFGGEKVYCKASRN